MKSSPQHDLSALHIAAWKGHVDVVDMLITQGCALEQKSKVTGGFNCNHYYTISLQNGKTAYDLAKEEGHIECCALLEAAMGLVSLVCVYCKYVNNKKFVAQNICGVQIFLN